VPVSPEYALFLRKISVCGIADKLDLVGLRATVFRRSLKIADHPAATNPKAHVVLKNLSEEVRECLEHAEDCARRAAAQTDAKMKEDFFDLERRWLSLARSYQFTERLDDFCGENKPRAAGLAKVRHQN
jgi:hypothetical protein